MSPDRVSGAWYTTPLTEASCDTQLDCASRTARRLFGHALYSCPMPEPVPITAWSGGDIGLDVLPHDTACSPPGYPSIERRTKHFLHPAYPAVAIASENRVSDTARRMIHRAARDAIHRRI